MKQKIIIMLIVVFSTINAWGQCPSSPILIQSQAGLDSFQVLFPNCTEFNGTIFIENVNNLNGLSQLTSFETMIIQVSEGLSSLSGLENIVHMGSLTISSTAVSNLDNLSSLTSMGTIRLLHMAQMSDITALQNVNGAVDRVVLENLPLLANLNGMQGISSLNSLVLQKLPLLTNIDELVGVTAIYDTLSIEFLDNLVSLETSFQNITMNSMSGLINIEYNDLLTSIGSLIENISGPFTVKVQHNDSLASIAGLSGTTGIEEINSLWIQGNEILSNFEGLESVNSIGNVMYIGNNSQLLSIGQLQNITFIDGDGFFPYVISLNPMLTSIDGLFAPNTYLNGRGLRIGSNDSLENLNGCENIIGVEGSLQITGNDMIENLDPLQNISGDVASLSISGNDLVSTLNPLLGITGAGHIRVSHTPLITNLSGLENIAMVPENMTFLTNGLVIENNLSLNNISAISNLNLVAFDSNMILEIIDNPELSVCEVQSVCDLLAFNGDAEILIENNDVGCESEASVMFACNLDINLVSGDLLFDFNNDGCDVGDYPVSSVLVESTDGINTYATFSNTDGSYNNYMDIEGTVNTSIVGASIPPFFAISPSSAQTTFVGFGNEDVQDFCFTATQELDDLKISLVPATQAIPGFDGDYIIVYENIGSTVLDADIILTFDGTRQTFVAATPAPTSIVGNTITWSLTNFPPFSSGEIQLTQNNFAPPINQIGDMVSTTALIQYVGDQDDASPLNNTSQIEQTYIGAYDPNDKAVAQGEEISENEVGEYLDYIVRFQNTGNANANIVRIEDMLDANLDWNTIRPLGASHAYRAEILNGNQVAFIFEDINLPPEQTDPEGSQGYIAFQIKTQNNLLVGDMIENTASIFFDFNLPIVTNTVVTTVVDTQAPEAICGAITVSLDANGQAFITASDVDNGSNDTNGISSLSIDIDTFDCTNIGENMVELTVTDNFGNISTCNAIVTVEDTTGPLLICQAITIELDEDGLGMIDPFMLIDQSNPLDNCGLDSLTASINTVNCDDIGTMEVTIFALDVNGNVSSCTTMVTVTDITAPIYDESTLPVDVVRNVDGSGIYVLEDFTELISATDNCSEVVNLSQSQDVGTPLGIGVYTVIITATDTFGNTIDHEFTLTVDPLLGTNENIIDQVVLYPNPVSEVLQIQMADEIGYINSTLFSILGEQILITSEETIDMSTMSTGIYFVKIATSQGEITRKVVKE